MGLLGFKTKQESRASPQNADNMPEQVLDTSEDGKSLYAEDIVGEVRKKYEDWKEQRLPWELQWQLNMNFLQGNQYCNFNEASRRIEEIAPLYDWQERNVYNHIAPIYETRLANLGRVNPSMRARPSTNEQNDIATSKVTTAVLKGTYKRVEMFNQINKATGWSEITGTVFYKNIWDKEEGAMIGQLPNEQGEQQALFEGDVETFIVPSFEILPDNPYNSYDECRAIIHHKAYHVKDIEDKWGVTIPGKEIQTFGMSQSDISLGGLGYNANINKVKVSTKNDHEIVIEYYERPTKKFPNGRFIIIAADKLLFYGELPYMIGNEGKREFPFEVQYCVECPGSFWGTSWIERVIPIQRQYNALKNRKQEFLNRAAIGIYEFEADSVYNIDDIELNGMPPGTMLEKKVGSAPVRPLQQGNLPVEFQEEESRLLELFTVISGVSDFAKQSMPPTGNMSGVSLEIVKEQDSTRLSLTAENIRRAVVAIGIQWVRLYRQLAITPRIIKFVGENNDSLVIEWSRNDLTTDDVIIEGENELAQTPAQRKQFVMDLYQAGILNDPVTGRISKRMRNRVLSMLQLGDWENADDISDLHIAKANRENLQIEKGMVPQVASFDDHELHLQEHNRYRLSFDYEQLKTQNPMLAQQIDLHCQVHEQTLQLTIQSQMMSTTPTMQQ